VGLEGPSHLPRYLLGVGSEAIVKTVEMQLYNCGSRSSTFSSPLASITDACPCQQGKSRRRLQRGICEQRRKVGAGVLFYAWSLRSRYATTTLCRRTSAASVGEKMAGLDMVVCGGRVSKSTSPIEALTQTSLHLIS
jgi:hypothetical protein